MRKIAGIMVLGLVILASGAGLTKENQNGASKGAQSSSGTEAKSTEPDLSKSFKKLFPNYDNDPKKEVLFIAEQGLEKKCDYEANKGCRIYPVKQKKELLGFAIIWETEKGFKGPIKLMLGVTPGGDITGLDILAHKETPQLGGKVATDQEFQAQFIKKNLNNTRWKIEKDGGDIRAITGASFSSRAVTEAVKEVLEFYNKHQEELKKKSGEK